MSSTPTLAQRSSAAGPSVPRESQIYSSANNDFRIFLPKQATIKKNVDIFNGVAGDSITATGRTKLEMYIYSFVGYGSERVVIRKDCLLSQ